MLHLDDRWIWDFWLIDDGPDHHVFYLQAPRSLGDPELRHRHATIGHAVSGDLQSWERLPDALGPGPAGAWDDNAPWTGSIIRAADRWQLCYTGTSSVDGGVIQRIGIAVSDDLIHWERPVDHPVISADHQCYERLGDSDWFDEAWRDPWLMTDPRTGDTLAFICARTAYGPSDERGSIGLARSSDLHHWTVDQPVYAPGLFAQMEVPQVLAFDGHWYLLFCTPDWSHSRRWTQRQAAYTTTYYVVGADPTGPFTTEPERVTHTASDETHYAGKLHAVGDQLVYLATTLRDEHGAFVGDLTDPQPVTVGADGRLSIEAPSPTNPPATAE
jgi:beta-fructofuranosidase